jgi:hypothetical protein
MRPQRAAATIAFLFVLLGLAMLAAPFYEALAVVHELEARCALDPECRDSLSQEVAP